jgi:hypothetical protein
MYAPYISPNFMLFRIKRNKLFYSFLYLINDKGVQAYPICTFKNFSKSHFEIYVVETCLTPSLLSQQLIGTERTHSIQQQQKCLFL